MATLTPIAPTSRDALHTCLVALRRLADYTLDPALDRRMQFLGEKKELLDAEEYAELMALVGFSQQRSLDKFQAQLALQRLEATFPELVEDSL